MTDPVGYTKSQPVSIGDAASIEKQSQAGIGQFHGRDVVQGSINVGSKTELDAAIKDIGRSMSSKKVNIKHRPESIVDLSAALESLKHAQENHRALVQSQYKENPL